VGHLNIIGEVFTHSRPVENPDLASPNALRANVVISNDGSDSDPYYVVKHSGGAVSSSEVQPPVYRAESRLTELKQLVNDGYFDAVNIGAPFNYNRRVYGLTWRTDALGNVDRVFYRVENTAYGSPGDGITDYLWLKQVAVVIDVVWYSNPTPRSLDVPFGLLENYCPDIRVGIKVTRQYARALHESPGGVTSSASISTPVDSYDLVSYPVVTQGSFYSWLITDDRPNRFHQYIGWNPYASKYEHASANDFLKFARLRSSFSSDMFPAAFFAQGDALDKGFATLHSNILETLVEIQDYLSPIDLAKDLSKILTGGFNKPGAAVWAILDFLANWKLTYSFGYAPTESLAKELSRNVAKFAAAWRNATRWQTFRGSYSYLVSGDDPPFPEGTVIRGGSKIRCRVPPDSILPYLLPLDSLGLMPSLSRVWDILPFSFIWDWFFNISGKIEVVDLTAKLSVLQIAYVVNSIKVISPFPEEDQEEYGFTAVPGAGLMEPRTGYCYYGRYVLPTYQVMTPTRFGFLAGKGVPDYWLAGSLLFKLLT
jgi:hypothetical protein